MYVPLAMVNDLTGDQIGFERFVQACTIEPMPLPPVMTNPNQFVVIPKYGPADWSCGADQPSVLGW